jgi:hypothetical protein
MPILGVRKVRKPTLRKLSLLCGYRNVVYLGHEDSKLETYYTLVFDLFTAGFLMQKRLTGIDKSNAYVMMVRCSADGAMFKPRSVGTMESEGRQMKQC